MVNLCICSMQVHQSRVTLSVPIVILSGCFLMLAGLCASVRGGAGVADCAPLRYIPFLASLLFIASFLWARKGYMHLSAPRNRYMHTMASKGKMLFMKLTM